MTRFVTVARTLLGLVTGRVRRERLKAAQDELRQGLGEAKRLVEASGPVRRCPTCAAYFPAALERCPADATELAGPPLCRGSGEAPGRVWLNADAVGCAWCAAVHRREEDGSMPGHLAVRPPPPPADVREEAEPPAGAEDGGSSVDRDFCRNVLMEALTDLNLVAEELGAEDAAAAERLEGLARQVADEASALGAPGFLQRPGVADQLARLQGLVHSHQLQAQDAGSIDVATALACARIALDLAIGLMGDVRTVRAGDVRAAGNDLETFARRLEELR